MSKSFNSKYPFEMSNGNSEDYWEGTIPIKKKTEEDILRTTWTERFKMRNNNFTNPRVNHEYAVGYSNFGSWTSSKASLGIWNPHVEDYYEFSVSQLWVTAGSRINQTNSIEAGWHVYPRRYHGDRRTRFFTYWTNNNYQDGYGCYNLDCPGFTQTSTALTPGDVLINLSVYGVVQHVLTLSIEWREDRKWWLFWHTSQEVHQLGYWEGSMFPHLNGPADMLEFGGEIINNKRHDRHTMTQMGSGNFANAGLTKAAFVSNIEMNGQSTYNIYNSATNPDCYNYSPGVALLGRSFSFGGPGYGGRCR